MMNPTGPVPLTNAAQRSDEEERIAKYTTQVGRDRPATSHDHTHTHWWLRRPLTCGGVAINQMYRAPEMVDLYMRRQLDEKVDIWVRQEAHRQPGASLPPSTVVRGERQQALLTPSC